MATVANGKVTAVSAGSATVTATAGDKSATCVVTVETVKTVTSEQWKQAMESPKKFVIEMKQGEMTNAIKIDGDKRMQAFGNEMYLYVKETLNDETEYFSYYYDGTKWEKTVIDENDYSNSSLYAEITTYFKDDFASFAYADGKYTAASLDKTSSPFVSELTNVEATFENGALTGMKFVCEGNSVEIKEIGTTNITVPTEYVDSTAPTTEVTAEEWVKNMRTADNFTIKYIYGTSERTIKIEIGNRSQSDGTYEQIYTQNGGSKYYKYSNVSGSWVKTDITQDEYEKSTSLYAGITALFADDFNSFEYADGKYTAASLDKTETMNAVLTDVEVVFENGNLVGIKFVADDGSHTIAYEINDFNETCVTIPEDYTDNTVGD